MNKNRLFIASCLSLVVTAMIFALRGNVEDLVLADPAVRGFFNPSDIRADYGWLSTMAFFGFAASILVTSPMLDALGMRNLLYLAFALHIVGVLGFMRRRAAQDADRAVNCARLHHNIPPTQGGGKRGIG